MQDEKYGFVNQEGEIVIPLIYEEVQSFHNGYAIVKQDGKYGIIDMQGRLIILIEFDHLIYHGNQIYYSKKNGLDYQLLKITTNKQILKYHHIELLNNLYYVEKDNKWGIVNESNEVIIPFIYSSIYIYDEKYFKVRKDVGTDDLKSGIIDVSGNEIIPCIYDEIK